MTSDSAHRKYSIRNIVPACCWKQKLELSASFFTVSSDHKHELTVSNYRRDEKLQVVDYCQRNLLDLSAVELSSSVTGVGMAALISSMAGSGMTSSSVKSAAWLTLIQNSSQKTCEMIVLFDSAGERSTLLELVQPSPVNGEKIYECWDCPNVEIIQDYHPTQEDHLPVRQGDIANVLRKSDEGINMSRLTRNITIGWSPELGLRYNRVNQRHILNLHSLITTLASSCFIHSTQSHYKGSALSPGSAVIRFIGAV